MLHVATRTLKRTLNRVAGTHCKGGDEGKHGDEETAEKRVRFHGATDASETISQQGKSEGILNEGIPPVECCGMLQLTTACHVSMPIVPCNDDLGTAQNCRESIAIMRAIAPTNRITDR
jgi:hypothetical protein